MGTNLAPLVADLFLFCYGRDFMKSVIKENGMTRLILSIQNNYMEGLRSAKIKLHSPSQAPRGRGNLSKQKPHNYRLATADKLAFSSLTEVIDPLSFTYK